MSYVSTVSGCIRVRSEQGMTVLHEHFDPWSDPRAEGQVSWDSLQVEFQGLYLNLGRSLELCLRRLHAMNELADVQLQEETIDGQDATYQYALEAGQPLVVCQQCEGETTRALLVDVS